MGKLADIFSNEMRSLTFTEKQIFYYIENHLEKAQSMSLTTLAEENNVSTTSIVRMSHKLGFSGFSELKFNLKQLHSKLNAEDTLHQLIPVQQYMEQLSSGLNKLDIDLLIQAAKRMRESEKVVIISVGLTKMVGEYMSKRLMQLNCSSSYIYESHMIDLITNWVNKKDCVIFISSSGNTKTLLKAAEKINHLFIPTIVLTNNSDSQLMQTTDLAISLSVQNQLYHGYDISARSFLVVLSDLVVDYYHMIEEK